MKEYNRFSKGMFGWVGFRTKWLEYHNVERAAGETKWSVRKLLRYSLDGILAGALFSGRSKGEGRSWKQLLLPDFSTEKVLYSPYGLGLTAMAVILLCIWIGWKSCKERMLAVCLAVVFVLPVCSWTLNGGLYARSKVFLPFLPIVCYLCAAFLKNREKEKYRERKLSSDMRPAA